MMTVKLKHPGGSIAEVTDAQAERLVANGVGWRRVAVNETSSESLPEAGSEPAEGDDTQVAGSDAQEPSQSQEEPVAEEPVVENAPAVEETEVVAEPEADVVEPFTMEDIRAWARANRPDLGVKEAGRVSRKATEAYREAHNL